ncbi:MAG: FkbM family methyltransferase, partial [Candidatus Nanopelagicales bacterium]|nr:FkbM family methyltransferase [Candidatus Nanopelagicales bacterium]
MAVRRISYAQNAEDIRVWRAFRDADPSQLRYIDVGANEPRHLSITASLYDQGWRGLLIEADPDHAEQLRILRPHDTVVECAAAAQTGSLTFHRVPGTGLGTLASVEAEHAAQRGFETSTIEVPTRRLSDIIDEAALTAIHFMSIDVEGAEAEVLAGLELRRHRPWVLCIEAVLPGTSQRSHAGWEAQVMGQGYAFAAFDGVNAWYVADEHAGLIDAVATPYNQIDAGADGWVEFERASLELRRTRADVRRAWQRELLLHDIGNEVPTREYEQQIGELRGALAQVEGSRAWKLARRGAKAGRIVQFRLRQGVGHLPGPLHRSAVRRRHLKHVTINQGHLTDRAYLGSPPTDVVGWIRPEGRPVLPAAGMGLATFTAADADAARAWLDAGPYDDDATLDLRTDNHDDEIGRLAAALRLRLALSAGASSTAVTGGLVLFDARSLQTASFGARGIGRFARAALESARAAAGDDRLVLLVDTALEALPSELVGACRQVRRISAAEAPDYCLLVQPSPMTAPADPLLPVLLGGATKVAIVFDFIPAHYPTIYLSHAAGRAEYAAALDALRCYDDYVCISHVVERELRTWLGRPAGRAAATSVAWPSDVLPAGALAAGSDARGRTGPIVVMTGDEPRKNTYGALAAIGAATAGESGEREVSVLGMAGQGTRVHHWSIAAAMRPGEATTLGRISDDEMHALLASASLVVVASFDEGLSLPVIEALRAGAPVVASDITAHRELVGAGSHLAAAGDIKAMARAIREHRSNPATVRRERRTLQHHEHEELESVIAARVERAIAAAPETSTAAAAPVRPARERLSIGVATPWEPQRSGVADFSAATVRELAKLADVTVYTTSGGVVDADLAHASVDALIADGHDHDVLVSVVGNSHFHVPFIELLAGTDAVVIAHDTRMVEYYMALRGKGGVEQVMTRGQERRHLDPPLDDQIDDMRLLQNAGFWEIARQSRLLVLHSPTAAGRIAHETGVQPRLLPFANQRVPHVEHITDELRAQARARLGFTDGLIHLGTFGYVDLRTKLTDVVVEAAAWLSQWGHPVSLHLAGSASDADAQALARRAQEAGIAEFTVTGFLTDEEFRDHLLAVDIGVQLRVSPLLGVSGPLSDLAAFGTTSIASAGLAIDVDTPAYVDRLPDEVSSLMVAEAIEHRIRSPFDSEVKEQQRLAYLDA